jgi:hypothetical protein
MRVGLYEPAEIPPIALVRIDESKVGIDDRLCQRGWGRSGDCMKGMPARAGRVERFEPQASTANSCHSL